MDDPNTTTDTLETEEDILTYTVSDDALEVAADMEKLTQTLVNCPPTFSVMCPS
jgi:hypothetical protein